jgi:hypothetical protein
LAAWAHRCSGFAADLFGDREGANEFRRRHTQQWTHRLELDSHPFGDLLLVYASINQSNGGRVRLGEFGNGRGAVDKCTIAQYA